MLNPVVVVVQGRCTSVKRVLTPRSCDRYSTYIEHLCFSHLSFFCYCFIVGADGPLIAHPDLVCHSLHPQDEFLLLGSDGLWDVFSSERAVEYARQRLLLHNDPQRCAEEMVQEALRMHTSDNVTCIAVCFGEEPPKRRMYRSSAAGGAAVSRNGINLLAELLNSHAHL